MIWVCYSRESCESCSTLAAMDCSLASLTEAEAKIVLSLYAQTLFNTIGESLVLSFWKNVVIVNCFSLNKLTQIKGWVFPRNPEYIQNALLLL